jgi:RNA 3'-terminal phosphate cyclase
MGGSVIIDGSHGEGGGQILRTALTLSAITGRPLRMQRLRAGRPKPCLAAQHVTAVLSVCQAQVSGATLGSQSLSFWPTLPPRAGHYVFDVAAAREGVAPAPPPSSFRPSRSRALAQTTNVCALARDRANGCGSALPAAAPRLTRGTRGASTQTILGAPAHLRPVALMPLGYPADAPERRRRRPLRELMRHEQV